MKEKIELLEAKIRALELEIELLKAKQNVTYIPYPYNPWATDPSYPQIWYSTGSADFNYPQDTITGGVQ